MPAKHGITVFDQSDVDDLVSELVTNSAARKLSTTKLEKDLPLLDQYLMSKWDLSTVEELQLYMLENEIRYWSPLPLEAPESYQLFLYYLQLPTEFRTKANVNRIHAALRNGKTLAEIDNSSVSYGSFVLNGLFWEARSYHYDQNMHKQMALALEENSKHKIATMRNANLTVATIATDIAIEMLAKAALGLRSIDVTTLSTREIIEMVKTSILTAKESSKLGEQALVLSDLLLAINELEELDEEMMAFIEAEVISDAAESE